METIKDLGSYTFKALFNNSIKKFAERPALALVGENPITYKEFATKTKDVARLLASLGLVAKNKVAILSTGRPQWGIAYFALANYGMIAVPLLPDFSDTEIQAICDHCTLDAIFVESKLWQKIKNLVDVLPPVVIQIEDFAILRGEEHLKPKEPVEVDINEDDIASIIYTSGTTGRSKGVVLTHKNIVWNSLQCQQLHRVNKLDRVLSFLPLSHVYEFTIGFVLQILNGACVYYLGKPPVVSTLLPAFAKVQPTIVLSVPLIIEKIYKNKVLPTLTKNAFLRAMYAILPIRKILHKVAGKQLKKTFGGHLTFFGIGGAKVDKKVEQFMKDARFPYAIGYGLTETSPLLAGSGPAITAPGTIGIVIDGVDLQIANADAQTGIGEVVAKGPNVMQGYYKNDELTREAFTTSNDSCGEGYFKTGDLGVFVKKHGKKYLALKGRCKNMILGPSGENIYPEDIEFILNQHPFVTESLVVEDDKGLVALVQFDEEKIEKDARTLLNNPKQIVTTVKNIQENIVDAVQRQITDLKDAVSYKKEKLSNEIQFFVNSQVNKNARISKVQSIKQFEKTATQKIKRYLYDMRTKVTKDKK